MMEKAEKLGKKSGKTIRDLSGRVLHQGNLGEGQ
jgi:hypothetical protein